MDLPAVGEHVFAVEGIEKKRLRKVQLPKTRTTVNGAEDAFVVPVLYPMHFRRFFRAESSIWWSGEDGLPSKCLIGLYVLFLNTVNAEMVSVVNVLHPTSVARGCFVRIPSQILREWICICTVGYVIKYARIFICLHYLKAINVLCLHGNL